MEIREPKVKIFYSYSHKDEELREKFEAHMSGLKRTGFIEDWHDRKILPGQTWENAINSNMENSDIVLFLISSDFLSSDYCYNKEVIKSVERHNQGKCIVVPIMIRDCDWEGAPFESIQGLPTDMKPVISRHWHDIDEAFANVARGLKKIIKNKYQEKLNKEKSINPKKNDLNPNEVSVVIRNLLSGDEVDVELQLTTRVGELLEALKDNGIIDKENTFHLIRKEDNTRFSPDKILKNYKVKNGDVLLLTVEMYAG